MIIWDVVDGRQLKLIQAHQMAITSDLADGSCGHMWTAAKCQTTANLLT